MDQRWFSLIRKIRSQAMMSKPVHILVRADAQRTSPNQRLHWQERRKRNQRAYEAAVVAWTIAGRPKCEGKVRVDIIIRRGRRVDNDNAISACKPYVDRLFCANRFHGEAIVADDSAEYLEIGTVSQETGAKWKGAEEIEFVVRPIDTL